MTAWRALVAILAAATAACASTPTASPYVQQEEPPLCASEEVGARASVLASRLSASTTSDACVRIYVDANPSVRVGVAQQIAKGRPTREGVDLALQLLEHAPAQAAVQALQEIERDAEARNDRETAQRAANERVLHAEEGRIDPATNYARADAASAAFREGRYAEAARVYQDVTFSDPTAVRSAERAVASLVKLGPAGVEQIPDLCRTLLSHDRAAQGLACVRAIPSSSSPACPPGGCASPPILEKVHDRLWMEACAAQPVLGSDELRRLGERRPQLGPELAPIERCEQPGSPSPGNPSLKGLPMAAVYIRLLDGLGQGQTARSRCLLQAAAEACIAELKVVGVCSEPRSIGRYVELLAATNPKELSGLVDGPLHEFFDKVIADKGAMYHRWNKGDARVAAALFNMHVSLAYALSVAPIQGSPLYEPAYHVRRAQEIWRLIGQGQPFPQEALEGVKLPVAR